MTDVNGRMDGESRRQLIVQAALEAIGEYGIQGATISRIAQGAGITSAALYAHFENRRAILVAALDAVYGQIMDSFLSASSDDPVLLFRQIGEAHREKVLSQDKTSHAHVFLEFVASAPEEGLREVLREKELENTAYLASIVRRFQDQGRLPRDVDAEAVGLLVACWAWTGDVANLMDASNTWNEKVSSRLWDVIVQVLSGTSGTVTAGVGARSGERPSLETGSETSPEVLPSPAASDDMDYDGLREGAVFTVEEVGKILKAPTETIDEMVRQGQIASIRIGNEIRVPRRALLALLRGMSDEDFDSMFLKCTAAPEG